MPERVLVVQIDLYVYFGDFHFDVTKTLAHNSVQDTKMSVLRKRERVGEEE
jgi:hypothetical protein